MIVYLTATDDPAEMIMELLVLGIDKKKYESFKQNESEFIGQVGTLSPLWKQTTAALSTGPMQFGSYTLDRVKNRIGLPKKLKEVLPNDILVEIPKNCKACSMISDILYKAEIKYHAR